MALDKSYGIALGWPRAPGRSQPSEALLKQIALTSPVTGERLTSAINGEVLISPLNAGQLIGAN